MTSIYTMFVGPIMGKFLDYSHHIYRCTYLASFGLTVLALLAGFLLHSKFMSWLWAARITTLHGSDLPVILLDEAPYSNSLTPVADHAPRVINVNFSPPSAGRIAAIFIGALIGVLLIAALWTSYYTVGAESEGVVLHFGKFFKTVEPGLHFKLPFGIDAVTVVPTRRQLKLEFGFSTGYTTNPIQASQNPDEEKSMVTGDLNAALVEWVVQYRIEDPRQYLFDVRNPGETLRDLSEAAMREVIGDRTVDELITIGRQEIEIEALARMQDLSKRYHLGIRVDQVQLKNVNPPSQVQASFNEVNKAQQDRENAINIANGEYNKAVPKAKGEADQTIRGAEGYRFKRVNEAEGDVAAFSAVLQEYVKAPEITRTRLYLETMSEILPQMGQKIIVDESLRQLLPILPLSTKPGEGRP